MMIDRLNKELDELFTMQESGKKNKGNLKASGGIDVPLNPISIEDLLSPKKINTNKLAKMNMSPVPDLNFSDKFRDFFFYNKWSPNYWGNDKSNMSTLAQLSPVLSNIGAIFDRNKGLRPNDFYNPNANQVASLMHDRRVNIQPALEQILNSERIGHYNLRSAARTPGELMGNTSALVNQAMRSRADVMANKQNMDLSLMGQEAQMLQQEGMHRAGVNWNVMDWNKSADATRRNIIRTGLSQLSQWSQAKELQDNLASRDKEKLMILKDLFQQMLHYWDTIDRIKTER